MFRDSLYKFNEVWLRQDVAQKLPCIESHSIVNEPGWLRFSSIFASHPIPNGVEYGLAIRDSRIITWVYSKLPLTRITPDALTYVQNEGLFMHILDKGLLQMHDRQGTFDFLIGFKSQFENFSCHDVLRMLQSVYWKIWIEQLRDNTDWKDEIEQYSELEQFWLCIANIIIDQPSKLPIAKWMIDNHKKGLVCLLWSCFALESQTNHTRTILELCALSGKICSDIDLLTFNVNKTELVSLAIRFQLDDVLKSLWDDPQNNGGFDELLQQICDKKQWTLLQYLFYYHPFRTLEVLQGVSHYSNTDFVVVWKMVNNNVWLVHSMIERKMTYSLFDICIEHYDDVDTSKTLKEIVSTDWFKTCKEFHDRGEKMIRTMVKVAILYTLDNLLEWLCLCHILPVVEYYLQNDEQILLKGLLNKPGRIQYCFFLRDVFDNIGPNQFVQLWNLCETWHGQEHFIRQVLLRQKRLCKPLPQSVLSIISQTLSPEFELRSHLELCGVPLTPPIVRMIEDHERRRDSFATVVTSQFFWVTIAPYLSCQELGRLCLTSKTIKETMYQHNEIWLRQDIANRLRPAYMEKLSWMRFQTIFTFVPKDITFTVPLRANDSVSVWIYEKCPNTDFPAFRLTCITDDRLFNFLLSSINTIKLIGCKHDIIQHVEYQHLSCDTILKWFDSKWFRHCYDISLTWGSRLNLWRELAALVLTQPEKRPILDWMFSMQERKERDQGDQSNILTCLFVEAIDRLFGNEFSWTVLQRVFSATGVIDLHNADFDVVENLDRLIHVCNRMNLHNIMKYIRDNFWDETTNLLLRADQASLLTSMLNTFPCYAKDIAKAQKRRNKKSKKENSG